MLLSRQKCRLLEVLITALAGCLMAGALQIDLSETCSGSSLSYCYVTGLKNTIDQPLIWITKSPATDLNELMIHKSVLGRLPPLVFEAAPNLHTLIMHTCALNSLVITDFEKASQLHKLVLQNNRMFVLQERVFAGLVALEELYLSHNTLHLINRYAFAGLQSLKYLDLQQNAIRKLPEGIFEDLINLEHIDLSFNDIETITAQTFAKNTKLKTIMMSENKFSTFEPNSLMHLDHLHILDLSNTEIEELQVQSVDMMLVQSSKLQRCTISGFVVRLIAGNNALKSLTVNDKLAVRDLDLRSNKFESLDSFVGMLNLQKLDVSKNKLLSLRTSQSPMYLPFPNLLSLNLNSNRLQNLSTENFMLLLKLESLDLSFNQLVRLDTQIFQPLVNIEKLYIEGNRLFELNYKQLEEDHIYLHEVGIYENDWESRYLKNMINFFHNQGINMPMRYTPAQAPLQSVDTMFKTLFPIDVDFTNDTYHAVNSSFHLDHCSDGVSGIHPYWTSQDVIALITLIIVFIILITQFYSILCEETRLLVWCRSCLNRGTPEREPLQPHHRILEEDDSNV